MSGKGMFIVAYEQTVLKCLRDRYRATNTDPLAANLSLGSITGRPRGLFPDTLASGHKAWSGHKSSTRPVPHLRHHTRRNTGVPQVFFLLILSLSVFLPPWFGLFFSESVRHVCIFAVLKHQATLYKDGFFLLLFCFPKVSRTVLTNIFI